MSTPVSMIPTMSRLRPVAPLSSRQSQLVLPHGLEDGDDCIVPSTPTLYVPRRSDGFGEAVSSPHVPSSGRFTFSESTTQSNMTVSSEVVPEQTLETVNVDDSSMNFRCQCEFLITDFIVSGTGRSVPTTPLQSSPQEGIPSGEEQDRGQSSQADGKHFINF